MSRPSPQEIVEWTLDRGGEGTVALVRVVSQADVRWANSMLTTNGERTTTTLTVMSTATVSGGTGIGAATGPVRSRDDIDQLVEQARATAQMSGPAADAQPLVGESERDADAWDSAVPTTSGEEFSSLAPDLARVFTAGILEGIEHFGFAEHDLTTVFLGSTTGLRRRHTQPTARVEATAKSHSRTRSSWAGRSGRSMEDIDIASVEHDLRISHTRLGDQVAVAPLTLSSDPHDVALACTPFTTSTWSSSESSAFDAGLPLSHTSWITDGHLEHLISSRSVAPDLGVPATPLIDNLRLAHAEGFGTVDDLVGRTSHGLLITSLWYIRQVDPRNLLLTGLTRDGVYLVRHGEVVGSVGNYRFNSSPVDLLGTVTDASSTMVTLPREFADYFTRAATPALAVSALNLSTRSDAL